MRAAEGASETGDMQRQDMRIEETPQGECQKMSLSWSGYIRQGWLRHGAEGYASAAVQTLNLINPLQKPYAGSEIRNTLVKKGLDQADEPKSNIAR